MLNVKNVSFQYSEGKPALQEVNLSLDKGEIAYLIGESGSGKTTLLKILQGRILPSEGVVEVDGVPLTTIKNKQILSYRQSIGPIFQEFRLMSHKTVQENIKVGIEALGLKWTEVHEHEMLLLLEKMGIESKVSLNVEALSYGEKQRVAIARALIRKPKLLLADEPTGNLDDENALNVLKLLTDLKDENTTVIIATHAVHLLDQLPEGRIFQMRRGTLHEK